MKKSIYLDHNSTTPVDPEVLEAMLPYFTEKFGNAASASHSYGWIAEEAVDKARETVARLIGATRQNVSRKEEIIFTSGATESNNLAIKGIARAAKRPIHVITQKTEHKCVLDSCHEIEKEGHTVTYLDVNSEGFVDLAELKKAIRPETALCSIMAANNEMGTIQPIREISKMCHEKGIWFHSDAVQAIGKIPCDVQKEGIDLMSLSGHKIYGPKGIGALYVKTGVGLSPILHGGGHERGLRSGTLNIPGIVGLAKALEISFREMPEEKKRLTGLRDYFIEEILKRIDEVKINGSRTERLPHNISLTFKYVKAEELITALPELAFSTGSACSSGSHEPSYVIKALDASKQDILSTVRFGLGRKTTREEIDFTVDKLVKAVKKLRSQSLEYEMMKNQSL